MMTSGKFMFTADRDYIQATLAYVTKPIDDIRARQFARPIDAFRRDKVDTSKEAGEKLDASDRFTFEFVERVSRWIPANPSKPEIVAQHDATYFVLKNPPQAKADTEIVWANILEGNVFGFDRILSQQSLIALIGQRGAGKTAFTNYWLSKRNSKLEKDRTTWFRTDVTKILEISKSTNRSISDLFELYNRVHTVYVLLTYGGFIRSENVIKIIGVPYKNEFFRGLMIELDDDKYVTDLMRISQHFDKYADLNIDRLKFSGEDFSRSLVGNVIIEEEKELMESMARIFNVFIRSVVRNNIKVLIIIDGLDNISWTKGNEFYVNSCKAVIPFFRSLRERMPTSVKFIVAVRPETIDEIDQYQAEERMHFNDIGYSLTAGPAWRFFRCWIAVPPAKDVILCKLKAAANKAVFSRDREQLIERFGSDEEARRHSDRLIQSLANDMAAYFYAIGQEINRAFDDQIRAFLKTKDPVQRISISKFQSAIEGEDLYARLFFDFDVRALLDNLYRVLRVKDISGKMKVPLFDTPERLLQYLFLNGRAYMDTGIQTANSTRLRKDFTERGAVFPNIFWYDARQFTNSSHNWLGLCGLRVLQTLRFQKDFLAGDLFVLLHECFDYPIAMIVECVEAFIAFGLLEVNITSAAWGREFTFQCTNDNPIASKYKAYVNITEKSVLYLEYIWCRPDLMYYFALDTPLAIGFVEDNRLVQISRDFIDLSSIHDFYVAAIPTVAVMFRHICTVGAFELKNIETRLETSKCDFSKIPLKTYREFLKLPAHWRSNFEDFIKRGLEIRNPSFRDRAERLKENIEGVLAYESKDALTSDEL